MCDLPQEHQIVWQALGCQPKGLCSCLLGPYRRISAGIGDWATEIRLWGKEAARDIFLQSDELSEDRDGLLDSLPDLVADTPKTMSAAAKWKKALAKVGEQTALALKETFVGVASETARRLLFP